jgi:hypothetical protein
MSISAARTTLPNIRAVVIVPGRGFEPVLDEPPLESRP